MSFIPIVCPPGGGEPAGADVENLLLCDVDADGEVLGTALAVYEYDADGNPVGPPTFVDPATGDPYVAQGTLMPCPGEVGCLAPVQFCFTTTATGPVDHPGRQYDITLPINPGFAVQSLQVDATNHAANIVWDVSDPDGEAFRQELTTFMEGRLPAPAVVTITNPNAGNEICGQAQPMQIHIECLRLDQDPPDLIELVYNGGQDLILNPAYNETPPLNPPVSQGNYGFHLLSRQDDPGPFPINQPANDANCTNTPNRGWETNDIGRTFEIWGQDQSQGQNVTPTPRGTPVQEITSDGPPPGGRSTIWQTFQAPANGNFVIRLVHGARDAGEQHIITLDNGDTDDAQNGDLINDVTNPAVVTSSPGGPNPWTQFNQTIPLTGGNIYTLAFSSTNPVAQNRGGLFTDMRAFIDRPDLRATATTDDDTCVVSVDETTTVTDCQYWAPRCINGEIVSWRNVESGAELANAAFWGQAPAPDCCLPQPAEDGGGSVAANLVHNYEICGIVGGVPTTLNRVVITDASGGVLQDTIVGPDGAPVSPSSYTIGSCTGDRYVNDVILCDDNGTFLRKYIQSISATGVGQINSFRDFDFNGNGYTAVGEVRSCVLSIETLCLLDNTGTRFTRTYVFTDDSGVPSSFGDFLQDGTPYVPTAPIVRCDARIDHDSEQEILCDDNGPFLRRYAWQFNGTATNAATVTDFLLDGTTPYVTVGTIVQCPVDIEVQPAEFEFEEEILCDDNGPFFRRTTFNTQTQTYGPVQDFTLAGAPYVAVGVVTNCSPNFADREGICYTLTSTGTTVHTGWARHDDNIPNTPQTPNGIAFFTNLGVFIDPTLDGFTQVVCENPPTPENNADVEQECYVDSNGVVFYKTFVYTDDSGVPTTVSNVDINGNPFVPAVGPGFPRPCADGPIIYDHEEEILCDDNGPFIRRYSYQETDGTGVELTEVNDYTLAGAAYVTVGTVQTCSDCCPIVLGTGCWDDGVDSGTWVSVRDQDGNITITDPATGDPVAPADVVACPADPPDTLRSQGLLLAATQSWTPGSVIGTLTSVSFTVLTGTADVTDNDGTVLSNLPAGVSVTWTTEDNNTLVGPQLIQADAASSVLVVWTER